jgi:hypothetical protein
MKRSKIFEEHERLHANIHELFQDIPDDWSLPYFLEALIAYTIMLTFEAAPSDEEAKELLKRAVAVGKSAWAAKKELSNTSEEYGI